MSVEPAYLKELRNDLTDTITHSIPDILKYLYDNFIDVTPDDVKAEEDKIAEYHWNIEDTPMVFVYSYQRFAEACNCHKNSNDTGDVSNAWNQDGTDNGRL